MNVGGQSSTPIYRQRGGEWAPCREGVGGAQGALTPTRPCPASRQGTAPQAGVLALCAPSRVCGLRAQRPGGHPCAHSRSLRPLVRGVWWDGPCWGARVLQAPPHWGAAAWSRGVEGQSRLPWGHSQQPSPTPRPRPGPWLPGRARGHWGRRGHQAGGPRGEGMQMGPRAGDANRRDLHEQVFSSQCPLVPRVGGRGRWGSRGPTCPH